MRTSRRTILRSIGAGGLALPFLHTSARAERVPGTIVFGLSTYPPNTQPWANTGTASVTVKLQMYRGLLSYNADGTLRGELAESWTSDGSTGWTFKLRDAVFHNGKPVTSADVKWTLEEVAGPKSTAYKRTAVREIVKIETPDARTVKLITKAPNAVLPETLANPHMPIIAAGSTDNHGEPVGAGPYVMTGNERGVSIEMAAFDKFYRPGLPKTKKLRFVAYADENLRVAALQAGDVDIIEYVPWQSMDAIDADPKLALQTVDGPFMALSFNGGQGPFQDKLVRQAVAYAIKRDDIVKAAFYGRGNVLEGIPIAQSSPFFDKARSQHWKYDPAKAKALLAKAGHPNGFACTLLSTAQYGMHKSTAEVVQQSLAGIGVQVTLKLPDWATRVSLGNRGQYEFVVQGTTADNNDPDGLSSVLDTSLPPNNARSVNLPVPKIHDLFAKGREEFDQAKRRVIYAALEEQALDMCPLVGLAWRAQGYAMAKNLEGFRNLPAAMTFFSGLTLEETRFA